MASCPSSYPVPAPPPPLPLLLLGDCLLLGRCCLPLGGRSLLLRRCTLLLGGGGLLLGRRRLLLGRGGLLLGGSRPAAAEHAHHARCGNQRRFPAVAPLDGHECAADSPDDPLPGPRLRLHRNPVTNDR